MSPQPVAQMESAIIVFGRPAEPGTTKTRLEPAIGPQGAAALYAGFLRDTLETAVSVSRTSLFVAGEKAALKDLALSVGVELHAQCEGDLGDRMQQAIKIQLRKAKRVVLIGSDCPTLPARILRRALVVLDERPFVFGPSADGGYYLIGARQVPSLGPVRWSSSYALLDSMRGHDAALLEPWYDVDTPADLELLRAHLEIAPEAAPHTARALKALQKQRLVD